MSFGFSGRAVCALASAVLGVVVLSAPAAAQALEYRGTGTVVAKNKACTEEGWIVGEKTTPNMRFRPPKVGGNGKQTVVAMFYSFWATSFVLEKGTLGKSFKPVIAGATGSGTYPYENGAEMRLTSQSPSTITDKTGKVKIKGEVRGFDNVPGCVVTFSATLKKR
jgi:hypothetical protein